MLAPLGLFIWNRYSLGYWETVDASARKDRPALYMAAFVLLIPIGIYFGLRERSTEMVRGLAAVAILIGILAGVNRWIKLSVHMTLATFATIFRFSPGRASFFRATRLPKSAVVSCSDSSLVN